MAEGGVKTRFSINESGLFVDRDGRVLGRVTSITIEHEDDFWGAIGGGCSEDSNNKNQETPPPPEVEQVWAHYVAVFEAPRQTLNAQRKRCIRNALKVRSLEECKLAVNGLHVSPHHNGENDQRTKYLDIRYALKGNSARGESDEERIDKMIALATKFSPAGNGRTSAPDAIVQRLLDSVRHSVQTGGERERGAQAKARLEAMGFEVKRQGDRVWLETL